MFIVGSSIVSDELKDVKFCCNLDECCGNCCVEGDYGAPITNQEKKLIKDILSEIIPHLSLKAQQIIKKNNFYTFDSENTLVTQIIEGKDCVFAIKDGDNKTVCVFQKLYNQGKISFIKPISCHLYPIRITEFDGCSALNYHQWDICKSALKEGKKQNIPIYKYCKEPLIRKFGENWYNDLCTQFERQNKEEISQK